MIGLLPEVTTFVRIIKITPINPCYWIFMVQWPTIQLQAAIQIQKVLFCFHKIGIHLCLVNLKNFNFTNAKRKTFFSYTSAVYICCIDLLTLLIMVSWRIGDKLLLPLMLSYPLNPPPPKASKHILPSTVTLSTDSCRLLPRRTTFTVCHSLSFSFWPANSISGPLPVTEEGREGVQNHKLHKGERCATHTAHAHQHRFYTVGDNRSEENLHVWQCLHTTAHQFAQYRENRGGGGRKDAAYMK